MRLRGNHVDELISASLTGDLTDAERVELDSHLVRCETCRNTLAAFTAERSILSGLPVAEPPRDLGARVRSGIESGRLAPWWRRPVGLIAIGASAAVVAAAILAVVVFQNLDLGPVGQASGSPKASVSAAPSSSAVASVAPSVGPTTAPTFLGPGGLGYLSLTGAPLEALRLSFIADATGASVDAGTVSGPPIAAALSPDGQWLAYITQKGETGANEVWALHLNDGKITHLGCSSAAPFTNRLAWSPDSRYLAYTLVGVDLGADAGCEKPTDGADAWLFDTSTGQRSNFSNRGNAYAADFEPMSVADVPVLWVSIASETPGSGAFGVGADINGAGLSNIFLPLFSPDGSRAIFWSGTMTSNGGSWHFSVGGMPQLSGDFRAAGPASPWVGTPLFTDLTPVGGEAFASGDFAWGPDNDHLAFWDGAWTGTPQSADGTYPNQADAYVGSFSSGLLSSASALALVRPADAYLVAIAFAQDGTSVAVTLGLPSAGIGDPPSALLQIVPLDGSAPHGIGGGTDAPPWNGPAVYGY
ncbi:MAG: PD40 domain-containing protein [Chloroflexi bacterium]|nr:PD40 domain-containing protein [Chloroflexota bacterium]